MSGLGMENAETIIIDVNNNIYNGPKGLFSIVVDKFDGNKITSWHITDKYGEKSRNLGSAKCKTIDAVVGWVGTTIGKRVSTHIYKKAVGRFNWTKPKYVNELKAKAK